MKSKRKLGSTCGRRVGFLLLIMLMVSLAATAQDSLSVSPKPTSPTVEKASEKCHCISDSVFQSVQLGVVPGISTNCYLKNPQTVNDLSFNLLVGKVYSVRYLELGGLINMDESDVSYVQLAGIGNIVGGDFKGVQSSGIVNTAHSVKGVQHAGVINYVKGPVVGVQHAGVVNLDKGNVTGVQGAGVLNMVDSMRGFQQAGVFNRALRVNGMQAAGVLNMASNVKGMQLSGVVNQAQDVHGVQVSGVVNKAKAVKGFQLSVVNIADTVDGASLGVVNIIKHGGYMRWEVSGDEVFPVNVAFRSGVPMLHSILTAGIATDNLSNPTWTFGAGLGMSLGRPEKMLFDVDLTVNNVAQGGRNNEDQLLHRIYLGVDIPVGKKLSIAAGVTYNFFFYEQGDKNRINDIMPYSVYKENIHGTSMVDSWVGGKIAIRFR